MNTNAVDLEVTALGNVHVDVTSVVEYATTLGLTVFGEFDTQGKIASLSTSTTLITNLRVKAGHFQLGSQGTHRAI